MSTKVLFDRLQPVFEDMGYCCASDGWRLHIIYNTDGPRNLYSPYEVISQLGIVSGFSEDDLND